MGWVEKSYSLFQKYLDEQNNGERNVWVAFIGQQFAGYITLKWKSMYIPFQASNIQEIIDFNVLPKERNQGIGSSLLNIS
ncbi:MAG: GNAT family N-acetyltransferase [Alphaproteobacteria bacterium]